jgi:hypothetical protein
LSKIRKNSFEELFTELVNDVEAQFKFEKYRELIAEQKIMEKVSSKQP